jgi:hypothetical protein
MDKVFGRLEINGVGTNQDWTSYDEAQAEIDGLNREIAYLRKTFEHTHVNNGKDDGCAECGLDVRNPVHKRYKT